MSGSDLPFAELLQYEFGLLEPAARARFEARLQADPDLRHRAANLRRVLAPLDAWEAPEPPGDLAARISDAVQSTTPLDYVAATSPLHPDEAWRMEPTSGYGSRGRFRLREALAMAACLLFFVGVFMPGMARSRNRAMQSRCGVNLADLSAGLSMYANAHNGALPSLGPAPNTSWLNRPGKTYRRNAQHVTPAVHMRFLVPASLACPGSRERSALKQLDPADAAKVQALLAEAQRRYYSMQNMDGPMPAIRARVRVPLMADANPCFEGARFIGADQLDINSRAHKGRGQNVLFNDGSVQFMPTPVYLRHQDNIWQAGNLCTYNGTEIQSSATDAFLIP